MGSLHQKADVDCSQSIVRSRDPAAKGPSFGEAFFLLRFQIVRMQWHTYAVETSGVITYYVLLVGVGFLSLKRTRGGEVNRTEHQLEERQERKGKKSTVVVEESIIYLVFIIF
jgi:hypothetical protein